MMKTHRSLSRSNRRVGDPGDARRSGTTVVEMALVLPVMFTILFAIIEFGHAFMVSNTLSTAAKRAARYGVAGSKTSQEVKDFGSSLLSSTIDDNWITVVVKDASQFESGTITPNSVDYDSLSDVELSTADSGQFYVVRLEVPYEEVALMPPFWAKNLTLNGQAVARLE